MAKMCSVRICHVFCAVLVLKQRKKNPSNNEISEGFFPSFQTEAPLMVRPFLEHVTMSELHAIMTGGFATIAGGVLAAYIGFGVSASHLLSASVMSAPAALAISKIMYPETEIPETFSGDEIQLPKG